VEKDIKNIYRLISLINHSKRPVFFLGNGMRDSIYYLNELKKFNIPILLSWKAADFLSHNDNLYFGRPGSISTRYANIILQKSDLVINIGSRLDPAVVAHNYKNFAPNAKKIIVDIDQNEIDKLDFEKEIEFWMNSELFIKLLLERTKEIHYNFNDWILECTRLKNRFDIDKEKIDYNINYINPYHFISILSELLTNEDTIIADSSGSASEITQQTFKVKKGQRLICSPALGSMGFQLGQAIGACFASDKKRTICISGDGSIMLNIQELELISRHNLPIHIFIFSNNEYASIRNSQNKFFNGNLIGCDSNSGLTIPCFSKIAASYNIEYFYTHVLSKKGISLKEEIRYILNYEGPAICELEIDPYIQTQPKVMSSVDENGKLVSGTLENMWPYLDKEVLEEIMRTNMTPDHIYKCD
jgi:acetolactate synthase-1/2/3 large subunit